MSGKRNRKHRQVVRKNYRVQYLEFLEMTESLKIGARFRITWSVLWKLGDWQKRKRIRQYKREQKQLKKEAKGKQK